MRAPRKWHLPLLVSLAFAVVFRLPALLNAAYANSDTAVLGIQARHMLQGEYGWFLVGATYQASFEPLLMSFLFRVMGPTPVAMMLEAMGGLLLMMVLAYFVLRRRIGPWASALCVLTLAMTPLGTTWPSIYAPRQWCIAFFFIGIWLLDGAATSRWWHIRYALGAVCPMFAAYLDLYALQMLPGFYLFVGLTVLDRHPNLATMARRGGFAAAGALAGGLFFRWIRAMAGPAGVTCLSIDNVPHNTHLLLDPCLPATLGIKSFINGRALYPFPWAPPSWFAWVQVLGGVAIVLAYAMDRVAVHVRRVPWELKRLGLLALVTALSSLGGFLFSCRVADMWAWRYLSPITWMLPFAFAPVAPVLGRFFPAFIAPYLVSVLVGGWQSYGPFVDGPRIVRTARGTGEEEKRVAEALRARGVHYAAAQFFLAYRLSFLWQEDPAVVPINAGEDRFLEHRLAFETAKTAAYVFHPSEPRATPEPYEAQLRTEGIPFEREEIAGFTVIVFHRR